MFYFCSARLSFLVPKKHSFSYRVKRPGSLSLFVTSPPCCSFPFVRPCRELGHGNDPEQKLFWVRMRENPKKNKEDGVPFNQITSLHYTMQGALHSVRMVPLPRWSVTFTGVKIPHATNTASLGMTPVPRQHTCQSWCTGTQPVEAYRNKGNPGGSRGAGRQCSQPHKLHNSGKYAQPPSCLKAGRKGDVHSTQMWPCM